MQEHHAKLNFNVMNMLTKLCALLALFLVSVAAHGEGVYKWVDDQGQVHYGDNAPKSNDAAAQKLTLKDGEVSDEQRKEAEDRLARDEAYLKNRPRRVEASATGGFSAPAPNAPSSGQSVVVTRRFYCCVDRDDDRDDRRERSAHPQTRPQQPQQQPRQASPRQTHSSHMNR